MKRSILLPWTLLVLYIAAHWTWSSGLLVGLKYQHGYATKNDALILEALDQNEKKIRTSSFSCTWPKNECPLSDVSASMCWSLRTRWWLNTPRIPTH
ncbi:hypothetical protein [Prosthecobacter sp.]|uniref:hypothetical protein n=1 Tax=Prosthecobacter sp. TaxID=1965333 RepID=UPI0026183CFA|nr:hypothetical protein [Prosthecobacter sp.]